MSIISEIARIEEACFTDAWSESSLEDTFKHEHNHLLAVFDDGSTADDFVFQGSVTEVRRQIGNAVPPEGVRLVARRLLPLFTGDYTPVDLHEEYEKMKAMTVKERLSYVTEQMN